MYLYDYVIDSSLGICHGALRINVASQERGAAILLICPIFPTKYMRKYVRGSLYLEPSRKEGCGKLCG